MVEKFLHTSDLPWVFFLFCLVNRISYSFPPCFLRCELLFISYISPQMHHVDMALAQESPCVFHAIHLLEQERKLLRIPPQPHASGCADAYFVQAPRCAWRIPSNEKERRLARCASTRHTFPHGFLYTNAADTFFGVSRIHALYTYIPNRSLAALLANAKHRTECHRT